MTDVRKATPKKLSNGWGAWVDDPHVQPGDPLEITTKTGKTWKTTVAAVVKVYPSGAVVATAPTAY